MSGHPPTNTLGEICAKGNDVRFSEAYDFLPVSIEDVHRVFHMPKRFMVDVLT